MPKLKFSELDWGSWIYALLKAGITGGAGAVVSYLAMPVLNSMGIAMPTLTLKQLAVVVAIGVVTHLAAVLMKSPLPPADGSAVDISTVAISSVTHDAGVTTVATSTVTQTTPATEPPKQP